MKNLIFVAVFFLALGGAVAKETKNRKPSDAGSGGTGRFELTEQESQSLFNKMANNGFDMGDGEGYINKIVTCTATEKTYHCKFIDPTTYKGPN